MKYVYASRTGNVATIVESLGLNALRIDDGSEEIKEDYILFTYTDGYGDIPVEVEEFLKNNSSFIRGVIVSGDTGYGEAYCQAGDKISELYNCPLLYKVENMGSDDDYKRIKEILKL